MCVMCLSLFAPVLGLVLFNDAVKQIGNANYKRGLSGHDFIAAPSCVACRVFVAELSLSGCVVHLGNCPIAVMLPRAVQQCSQTRLLCFLGCVSD